MAEEEWELTASRKNLQMMSVVAFKLPFRETASRSCSSVQVDMSAGSSAARGQSAKRSERARIATRCRRTVLLLLAAILALVTLVGVQARLLRLSLRLEVVRELALVPVSQVAGMSV